MGVAMLFSQRAQLARDCETWCIQNGVPATIAVNVLAALDSMGLLKEPDQGGRDASGEETATS